MRLARHLPQPGLTVRSWFAFPLLLAAIALCGKAPTTQAAEPGPELKVPPSDVPLSVAVAVPGANALKADASVRLVEEGKPDTAVPAQLAAPVNADGTPGEGPPKLLAVIPAGKGKDGARRFSIVADGAAGPQMVVKDVNDKSLGVWEGDQPVLVYNHGTITGENVPEKDHRRTRACYVHPLWGLNGEQLTDDFPRDHYHHHGVFWTWPHIEIDGRQYDTWQGNDMKQQFVRWLARESGPAAAVIGVENGWFFEGKKWMTERVWIRAYKAVGDQRAVDFDLFLIPTEKPVKLWGAAGKSYGGLTVRFKPGDRKDTLITVPDGPTTGDLPNTPLKWADFTSKFAGTDHRSGATVMVDPHHPNYPPTWLTRYYGPLCVGWPGVEAQTLEPGKPVHLSYRIWIHKDAAGFDALKAAYQAYTAGSEGN